MRLWDCRMVKDPVHVWRGLAEGPISCIFSPDDTLAVTASGSRVLAFSRRTFGLGEERDVGEECLQLVWHRKLNQVVCGLRSGAVKVCFSPENSFRGALLCRDRAVRQRGLEADYTPGMGVIHNPDVEAEEARTKRKKERQEGQKRKRDLTRPDLPIQGKGYGGQLGGSAQHQMMKKLLKLDNYVPEDPREALLKYDAAARANPQFINQAYAETQPEQQLDEAGLAEYVKMEQLRKAQPQTFKPNKK